MSDLEMAIKHMANHIAERSNPPAPQMGSGVVEMRRMAATRGLEAGKTGDGNKESNLPSHAPANKKRVGDVKAPAKRSLAGNKADAEGTPPYSKESIGKDGWTKASSKAKQMYQARK